VLEESDVRKKMSLTWCQYDILGGVCSVAHSHVITSLGFQRGLHHVEFACFADLMHVATSARRRGLALAGFYPECTCIRSEFRLLFFPLPALTGVSWMTSYNEVSHSHALSTPWDGMTSEAMRDGVALNLPQ
jgi:hypothetical protein